MLLLKPTQLTKLPTYLLHPVVWAIFGLIVLDTFLRQYKMLYCIHIFLLIVLETLHIIYKCISFLCKAAVNQATCHVWS